MQVTTEVWRRYPKAQARACEIANVMYTAGGIGVTYYEHSDRPGEPSVMITTEAFTGRSAGDDVVARQNLANAGYELVLTTQFVV
jgi:hypothetical protein